jgi:hypothetical protein
MWFWIWWLVPPPGIARRYPRPTGGLFIVTIQQT